MPTTEPPPPPVPLRHRLRSELTSAMRRRDRTATSVLRTTLGAIDNAEAVAPAGTVGEDGGSPIAGAVVGLAAGDVPRGTLTEADVRALVERELEDRRAHAELALAAGRPDHAERAHAEAAVLQAVLAG